MPGKFGSIYMIELKIQGQFFLACKLKWGFHSWDEDQVSYGVQGDSEFGNSFQWRMKARCDKGQGFSDNT